MTSPSTAERAFAIGSLAYFAKAFLPFTTGFQMENDYSIQIGAQGNLPDQIVGSFIYVAAAVLLVRQQRLTRLATASPWLTIFLLLAAGSILWSAVPAITVRRAGGLLGTAVFAAYLAARFDPHEMLRMTAAAFAIAIALSLALIVAVPSVGMLGGSASGTFGHKNALGRAMVVAALAFFALLKPRPFEPRPSWVVPGLGAAVVLGFSCRSAQAVATMLVAFVALIPLLVLCSRWFRRAGLALALTLAVVGGLGWFAIEAGAEAALALLGRDATLTDRTVIWDRLVDLGWERPWLGRGYGAFWQSDAAFVFGTVWIDLDHSHNGYMDLWLDLGHAGIAAFGLLVLAASRRAWNLFLAHPSPVHRFFPIFILVGLILNFVGRVFPDWNSIFFVLLCYCALMPAGPARSASPAVSALRFRDFRRTQVA